MDLQQFTLEKLRDPSGQLKPELFTLVLRWNRDAIFFFLSLFRPISVSLLFILLRCLLSSRSLTPPPNSPTGINRACIMLVSAKVRFKGQPDPQSRREK